MTDRFTNQIPRETRSAKSRIFQLIPYSSGEFCRAVQTFSTSDTTYLRGPSDLVVASQRTTPTRNLSTGAGETIA